MRSVFAIGAAAVTLAAPLAAQQGTLRLGGFRTTYADTLSGTAGSVGAELNWLGSRSRLLLGGTAAQFTGGAWSAQAYGSAGTTLLTRGGLGLAVTGDGVGYALEGGTRGGTATAGLLAAAGRSSWLVLLTGTGGGVRRLDETDDPMGTVGARLRVDRAALTVEAGIAQTWAGAEAFSDASALLLWRTRRAQLQLSGGARTGDLGDQRWGQVRGEWWIAPTVALEASGGTYPRDVTGFLNGAFISGGLRLALGRGPAVSAPSSGSDLPVRFEPRGDGTVAVTFRVDNEDSIAIAGEWNGWDAQALEPLGRGRWRARLTLSPGVYRFSLVDGTGRWFVPAGIPTVPDDLGGVAGLLVVR